MTDDRERGRASYADETARPRAGGEPSQTGHVGHAVPGARFRDVQVGVGKW